MDVRPLQSALKALDEALSIKSPSDLEKDGCIQRFEYTFELAWRSLTKISLANKGVEAPSPKYIIDEATKLNLVDRGDVWSEYHAARDLTNHTYKRAIADLVYKQARRFSVSCRELLENLESA